MKCESCLYNKGEYEHKGKWYCYPHYLAVTADGQLFSEVTQHLSEEK